MALLAVLALPALARGLATPVPSTAVTFAEDPLYDPDVVLEGAGDGRFEWTDDAPAFPGDAPGSLVARYNSLLEAARIGWPLPEPIDPQEAFTLVAVFVIEPEGLVADPDGFFQISWGAWNSRTTGMERTGSVSSFAADTFELLEFNYFPNVSPLFGGPFLTTAHFGVANETDPLFPFLGGFTNFASAFDVQATLPLGTMLAAILEHRPADDAVVLTVHRVTAHGGLVPVSGASVVVPISALPRPEYSFDRFGLTLWQDGFGGAEPALVANVRFHLLALRRGEWIGPQDLLGAR